MAGKLPTGVRFLEKSTGSFRVLSCFSVLILIFLKMQGGADEEAHISKAKVKRGDAV
jgi:hypothetical protein